MVGLLYKVALLAEGVDRNETASALMGQLDKVALLAEGVDRNLYVCFRSSLASGRPPRGGRG